MKHLKSYKLFESKEDTDYIGLILSNLSDTAPHLMETFFDDALLLFDLNITNKDFDNDELQSAIGRLKDEGWSLLNICRDAKKTSQDDISLDDTVYCSVIKTDFLTNIKSKGVKLWKDLQWGDWHLNKSTKSNCLHTKFNSSKGEMISIIDGTGKGNNQIDWIEIYDESVDREYRFSNPVEAEVHLIKTQLK